MEVEVETAVVTRAHQKAKALQFMAQLGIEKLFGDILYNEQYGIKEFFSESYEDPNVGKIIERLEDRFGCLVYYVTHENTSFGECYSFLYVSKYAEDLAVQEIRSCSNDVKMALAWVENLSAPHCSEFGSVAVKKQCGCLFRVG